MRKYLIFTLHYVFFITALLFLPKESSVFIACLLLCILALNNIMYSVLPLILCLYYPTDYNTIIICVFVLQLVLIKLIKKNRFYSFGIYLISNLGLLLYFISKNIINYDIAITSIICFIIYTIINILYSYQEINNKHYTIPYSEKLVTLVMLLGYLLLFNYLKVDVLLYAFLFVQLFILKDYKYNVIFTILLIILSLINNITFLTNIPLISISSFFPIITAINLDYTNYSFILYLLYLIIATLSFFEKKKVSIENNYINTLFDDFNKYLDNLNYEYNKCIKLKELKEKILFQISQDYCQNCTKNTMCKKRLDKRYSFLSAAMLGMDQNIYDCPHYKSFNMQISIENANKAYEYSAIKTLAYELSTLYNQSIIQKKEYNKFINLLAELNYTVINIDIDFSKPSTFFSIELANTKVIIESLLKKCAYICFGEKLDIKRIDNTYYFYKKPLIKINYAHTVLAKEGNLISGDNYFIKKNYNSSYIFALSDGMGNGYNAYIESIDALKTISKLTSYHFRSETILKLLEDVYELRSNYDRYATLDFLTIDCASRKINLFKMGSTTTYILHNNTLNAYENKALPLKLDDVNSSYELDIYSGDFIFLLSDGISDFISHKEFEQIAKDNKVSAEEMCHEIISYIKRKENNFLKDDLSLIVIKAI